MTITHNHKGYWKFSKGVSLEELQIVAEELKKDKNYISLSKRNTVHDTFVLEIEYKNPEGRLNAAFDSYIRTTTKLLKKRFDGRLVGHNISPFYFNIK